MLKFTVQRHGRKILPRGGPKETPLVQRVNKTFENIKVTGLLGMILGMPKLPKFQS